MTKLAEKLEEFKKIVSEFPASSGVYLMKNQIDKIIYVGKAKSLKARVRSYFNLKSQSPKTIWLLNHIAKIDYILTNTELEAFLLEASLIKKHRPKYNIRLKDDKNYPYIKVSSEHNYPRLYLVRKVKKDGGHYFGPYTSGLHVWETIKFLNHTFQIRDCTDHVFKTRSRPCLTHQIGHCTAPCVKLVSQKVYAAQIAQALLLLKGRDKELLKILKKRMKAFSEQEQYEAAGKIRDSLEALKAIGEKQSVISTQSEKDQDVIGFEGDERGCTIEVMHVRAGKLIGSQAHHISWLNPKDSDENPQDWLASFLNQYYEENIIPDEVVLPVDLGRDINNLISDVLKERSGKKVKVGFGGSTHGQKLLDIANSNAKEQFKNYITKTNKKRDGLKHIQEKLGLKDLPVRIECFDISNFQGSESVASQVVFEDGVPVKDFYRRYKIKTVEGPNDFASMKEVLTRRLKHDEYESPDLIVVDGGKGQLAMAVEVLKELNRQDIAVVGLAKAKVKGEFSDNEVKSTDERIFIPGRQNPVVFAKGSEALHILTGIRDEAHRFAITYHRKLRENKSLESELDMITGLGEKRKKALLKRFESIEQIKSAQSSEIAELPGFNQVLAERILLHLNEE